MPQQSRLRQGIAERKAKKTVRRQEIAEQNSRDNALPASVGADTDQTQTDRPLDDLAQLRSLKFLRRAKVKELTGLSDATLWRYERRGLFPRRVVVTEGGNVAWVESEVLQWLHSRVRSVGKRPSHIAPARPLADSEAA